MEKELDDIEEGIDQEQESEEEKQQRQEEEQREQENQEEDRIEAIDPADFTQSPDYHLKNNWPKIPQNEQFQSIITANINDDQQKEIIVQSNPSGASLKLYVWQEDGQTLNPWPRTFTENDYAYGIYGVTNWGTQVSIGSKEILTTVLKAKPGVVGFHFPTIHNINQNKKDNWTLDDNIINNPPRTNLITASLQNNHPFDLLFGTAFHSSAFNYNGQLILPDIHNKHGLNITTYDDKIISTGHDQDWNQEIQLFQLNGTSLPNYPKRIMNLNFTTSISLANLNPDNNKKIIVSGSHQNNGIYLSAIDENSNTLSGFPKQIDPQLRTAFYGKANIKTSIGDLYNDQRNEIVLAYNNNDQITIKAFRNNGDRVFNINLPGNKFSEPLIADINNNGNAEILIVIDNTIHILDSTGQSDNNWQIHVGEQDLTSYMYQPEIILNDIDNNGRLDLISNANNQISVWELGSPTDNLIWPMPDQNIQRTRVLP